MACRLAQDERNDVQVTGTSHLRPCFAKRGLAALLLATLIVTAIVSCKCAQLWPHVSSLLQRWHVLQTLANGDSSSLADLQRLVWIREQLGDTRTDLETIRAEISPALSLAEHLGWVPRVGGDLVAAPALLEMAIHLCDAGWWALLGLEPLVDVASRAGEGPGQTALEAVVPVLTVCQPRFVEAEKALVRARLARERLDGQELSPRLTLWLSRLDRYLPALEAATVLAQVAPGILGHERPISYLILVQNSHELRPTGGFISGVGMIQLSAGKIITSTFQDSYQVDAGCDLGAHPPAPAPLRKYMWAPVLVFRDANWSPDFPSSVAVARSIYRLCRGTDVDGAIAIDLAAVAKLLPALGPLQPEGYPKPVTSETLLQYVAEYWTAPLLSASIDEDTGQWWTHRKDFMADLLQAALQKITTSPQSIEAGKLAVAMLESLRGKHLLVCLRDTAAARAFAITGWDGALRPAEGDYLMIVDSNVGFRKVNPNVQQSFDYQVDLGGERPRAALTVRYVNESSGASECIAGARYDDSYAEMMHGCYWDYVRVYVPRGSRLLRVVGSDSQPEISEEVGKTVFAAFFAVAPGESRELRFDYELPSEVVGGAHSPRYRLLVQKQPGSSDSLMQISVSGGDWRLEPSQANVTLDGDGQRVRFNLASDSQLTWVQMGTGGSQPAWLWAALGIGGVIMILAGFAIWCRA